MSNKIKLEIDKIVIPNELHERSKMGVQKAKLEIPKNKRYWSKAITLAASVVIVFGGYGVYMDYFERDQNPMNTPIVVKNPGLQIPVIKLPEVSGNEKVDMVGLIVYNGKIYTQTATEIDPKFAKNMLGEKLGTTRGGIDEWSKQDKYAVQFASTIGEIDVYSVKGYDKSFRIMSYSEIDGEVYSEYYECLNGITIHSGEDVFGKLNITGNIQSAQYRIHSDWDYGVERFFPIQVDLLKSFAETLNHAIPYSRASVEEKLGDFRNDENYRQMILQLKDGSKVSVVVLKDGYISYGNADVYFKIDSEIFKGIWGALNIHSVSGK
ncbi:hypothetical protein [Paenibacillus glacialis]|uniref:Uncharacterized protein n=1 Tax=Paenibacillus glacialis TaxID=494026 RepID=A0A162LY50_9BACL|nr:hypothetical protein [Paenibacillus glacialis]OAB41647.1 hypothetical protein PGLA_15315 [Paenibacillus glacialis]